MSIVFLALCFAVVFIVGAFTPPTYRVFHRAVSKAQLSPLERAKKTAYEKGDERETSEKTLSRVVAYIDRGEDVDWEAVIQERLGDPDFSSSSVREDAQKCRAMHLDDFSAPEQVEILESYVAGWVDGIKRDLSLRMAERDILARAKVAHNREAVETLSPAQSWEKQFAQAEALEGSTRD